MKEKWHVHTATGHSIRNESGEIIIEYPAGLRKFNEDDFCRWLDYAEHICDLHNASLLLPHYQKAINEIDDYFEYRMESKKDQAKVHRILAALTEQLKCV